MGLELMVLSAIGTALYVGVSHLGQKAVGKAAASESAAPESAAPAALPEEPVTATSCFPVEGAITPLAKFEGPLEEEEFSISTGGEASSDDEQTENSEYLKAATRWRMLSGARISPKGNGSHGTLVYGSPGDELPVVQRSASTEAQTAASSMAERAPYDMSPEEREALEQGGKAARLLVLSRVLRYQQTAAAEEQPLSPSSPAGPAHFSQ